MKRIAPRLALDPRLKFFLRRSALLRRLLLPRLIRARYLAVFGRPLNTRHPRAFTEKLACAKLSPLFEKLAPFADKYSVRRYVASVAGETVLVPLLAVADRAAELDWEKLPPAFVLKATHGSAWNVIVRDKAAANPAAIRATLDGWLRKSYSARTMEPQYARIRPRIIAETYLGHPSEDPVDYKFHCFGGEPRLIHVVGDRSRAPTWAFLDPEWHMLDVRDGDTPPPDSPPPPPRRLRDMFDLARRLSAPFPYVRVDLYAIEDRLYFGELTFTPANGEIFFDPPDFDLTLGAHFDLSAFSRPIPMVEKFFAAYPGHPLNISKRETPMEPAKTHRHRSP